VRGRECHPGRRLRRLFLYNMVGLYKTNMIIMRGDWFGPPPRPLELGAGRLEKRKKEVCV